MDWRPKEENVRAQLEAVVLVAAAEAAALECRSTGEEAKHAAQDRLSEAVAALATHLAKTGGQGWIGHRAPANPAPYADGAVQTRYPRRAWGLTARLPQSIPYSSWRRALEARLR